MLSYQKWKKLNENFGYTLGLGQPNKISDIQNRWNEMGVPMKMMKKKMFGGDDGADMDPEGEKSSGGPPFMKKKKPSFGKKPPMGGDDMGGEEDHDDDDMGDDLGHDDSGEEDHDDDDMGGEEDHDDDGEEDHDDDDMGGNLGHDDGGEEDHDDDDMGGDDAGAGLPMPVKKKGILNKTRAVADGAKMMHKGASKMVKGMKEAAVEDHVDEDDEMPPKKMGNQVMQSKKSKKKMTKEEVEFFRSLQAQTGGIKFSKDEDGDWIPVQEDSIIPPSDPNADIEDDSDEPGPGEVGYAPQGRVGAIGSFSEWSSKYNNKKSSKKTNKSSKNKGTCWFG